MCAAAGARGRRSVWIYHRSTGGFDGRRGWGRPFWRCRVARGGWWVGGVGRAAEPVSSRGARILGRGGHTVLWQVCGVADGCGRAKPLAPEVENSFNECIANLGALRRFAMHRRSNIPKHELRVEYCRSNELKRRVTRGHAASLYAPTRARARAHSRTPSLALLLALLLLAAGLLLRLLRGRRLLLLLADHYLGLRELREEPRLRVRVCGFAKTDVSTSPPAGARVGDACPRS